MKREFGVQRERAWEDYGRIGVGYTIEEVFTRIDTHKEEHRKRIEGLCGSRASRRLHDCLHGQHPGAAPQLRDSPVPQQPGLRRARDRRRRSRLYRRAAAISGEAARRLQLDVSSELQQGKDRLDLKREKRKAEKVESLTPEAALRDYVTKKRRTKDGLPHKERTRADYVAMLDAVGTTKTGRPTLSGELHALGAKPLHRLTAGDIRQLHTSLEPRGERRQTHALQVLRAVLRHHGVSIAGDPSPIPPERLGAWWKAACATPGPSADQLRFQLLTGCRPGEAAGITVGDFDAQGARVTLRDTKNRTDHVIMLSTQAAAIATEHARDKRAASALLFGVADPGKTLESINAQADTVGLSAHKLRPTFASIAAELVPAFTLRRLLNHVGGGDTASGHYVGVREAQSHAGWQAVADFICAATQPEYFTSVVLDEFSRADGGFLGNRGSGDEEFGAPGGGGGR